MKGWHCTLTDIMQKNHVFFVLLINQMSSWLNFSDNTFMHMKLNAHTHILTKIDYAQGKCSAIEIERRESIGIQTWAQ